MFYVDFHTHKYYTHPHVIAIGNLRMGFDLLDNVRADKISCGIHPWDANCSNVLYLIDEIISVNDLVMIGECGLDKNSPAPFDVQIELFQKHVILAEIMQLPLIIHCVGYFNELIKTYHESQPTCQWIIHGFRGHPKLAMQLHNIGFMFSFGDAIFNDASKASNALKALPFESFFLETDDSEESIFAIYNRAAFLKEVNCDELKSLIYNNYKNLFRVKDGVVE